MKKLRLIIASLFILCATAVNAQPMSYNAMRNNARFLTDRMAYTLGITSAAIIDDIYRINYDYISGVNYYLDDVALGYNYDDYMEICYERDRALQYLLGDIIWSNLMAYDYFYRPIVFANRGWRFSIYAHDMRMDHFYCHTPRYYNSYHGGHFFKGMAHRGVVSRRDMVNDRRNDTGNHKQNNSGRGDFSNDRNNNRRNDNTYNRREIHIGENNRDNNNRWENNRTENEKGDRNRGENNTGENNRVDNNRDAVHNNDINRGRNNGTTSTRGSETRGSDYRIQSGERSNNNERSSSRTNVHSSTRSSGNMNTRSESVRNHNSRTMPSSRNSGRSEASSTRSSSSSRGGNNHGTESRGGRR